MCGLQCLDHPGTASNVENGYACIVPVVFQCDCITIGRWKVVAEDSINHCIYSFIGRVISNGLNDFVGNGHG